MSLKTDKFGLAFKCSDIKITSNGHTYGMKLSQLHKQKGRVRIITYSLPALDYVKTQLGRRPSDIDIIAHSKFGIRAGIIKRAFPGIKIALHDEVHSKVVLIEPHTIIITSANFGDSTWHETSVSMHSRDAHDWYVDYVFIPLWNKSETV